MKIICPYCKRNIEMNWKCPHCHNHIQYDINNELERINPHAVWQKLQFTRQDYAIGCKSWLERQGIKVNKVQELNNHYLVYYLPVGKEQCDLCRDFVIKLVDLCLF